MFWVYILRSESSGRFYVGQTEDLSDRLTRHKEGRVPATRARGPWTLVYKEEMPTRSEACRRELEIKKQKSRDYIARLMTGNKGREGDIG